MAKKTKKKVVVKTFSKGKKVTREIIESPINSKPEAPKKELKNGESKRAN